MDYILSDDQISQLTIWQQQLMTGYPLAYIIGKQDFWDFELIVNEHTLIPRPDTETLIETCITLFKNPPKTILDLGTGSGAVAIALAKVFNQSKVTAIDASSNALQVALKNSDNNNITNIQFIQSNWFESIEPQKFDLVASNPPYIDEEDPHLKNLKHEPYEALVAADNGLKDFKTIALNALSYLSNDGVLVFEHGWKQKRDVQQILKQSGYTNIKTFKDLAGNDRVSCGHRSNQQ